MIGMLGPAAGACRYVPLPGGPRDLTWTRIRARKLGFPFVTPILERDHL
jgi:hypothetical protein